MNPVLMQSEVVSQGLVFRDAPALWVVVLLIVPALIAFTLILYRLGREKGSKVHLLLSALRVIVLVFMALLLMDPAMETLVVERRPTLTVVMADASASMEHRDDYSSSPLLAATVRSAANIPEATPLDTFTRMDLMKRVLDDAADPFLEKLGKEHKLRMYSFGERLQAIAGLRDLESKDRVTALGRALERVLEEPAVKSTPVGGIVLFSDGKNTLDPKPEEVIEFAQRRKIPIYTVGVGDPQALRDVEIASVLAPSVALVEDLVMIEVRVRHRGFAGQRIELRLLENGAPLARQTETLLQTESDQEFRLGYKPVRIGQQQWTLEVKPLPGEHTADNNRRLIDINVKSDKLKILYVETFPRWEYRSLKEFLVRGHEAFLTQCFLIEADRGFPQETTPGLPPLIVLPDSEEAIAYYDVILFGDVDPDKLGDNDPERSRKFMQLVKTFVEEGGGFGMIAGDRFAPRAYKDTPVGEILPVIIDPTDLSASADDERGFKFRLTELGRQHPVMQLTDEPERNRPVWETHEDPISLRESYWFAPVKRAKPGSMVLATHENARNANGAYPLMVSGTYGAGPVFFTAIDDTWRWYARGGAYTHHRYWGNVVRYLARTRLFSGDKRFRLSANRSEYQRGDRATLTAYVKDKTFRPSDAPDQDLVLRLPDGTERREKLLQVEPGKFEKTFVTANLGEWQAWLPPEDGLNDEKLSPVTFRVVDSDVERKEPVVDEATLRLLADKTGGRYLNLSEAKELLQNIVKGTVEIPRQRRSVAVRAESSNFLKWLPLIFLALLTTEWIVRKRFRFL